MMTRKIFSLSTISDERNASIKKSKLLLYEILNEFSLHNDTTSAKCVINNFITTPVDILSVSLMWHYFWLKRHVVTVPICRGGVNSFPDIYHYPFYFIRFNFYKGLTWKRCKSHQPTPAIRLPPYSQVRESNSENLLH